MKEPIMQAVYQGIENPVIASALYQHNLDYLMAVISVVNAMEKPEELARPGSLGYSKELEKLVLTVIEHI